jgi:hypothetical protein
MPYPTGTDVAALLTASGFTAPDGSDLDPYAIAAARQWERETGWLPFIATDSVETCDPPGPAQTFYGIGGGGTVLRLRKGLLSINSVTAMSGTPFTLGTNLALVESAAGWPTEAIRFRFPIYGLPGSVTIDGVWGFCQDDPDDPDLAVASRAIVRMAAGQWVVDSVQSKFGTAVVSVTDDDQTVKFDVSLLMKAGEAWANQASLYVSQYKRIPQ